MEAEGGGGETPSFSPGGPPSPVPEGFMRRLRKKKAKEERPPVDVVNVELVAPLPWRGTSVLAQTLLKHLLFMRQQIPMPFDQLSRELRDQQAEFTQDGAQRRRPSTSIRKAGQLVDSVGAVLDGFNHLPNGQNGEQVLGIVMSFGPTPINPKEAYILRVECSASCEEAVSCAAPVSKKADVVETSARKLIRSLVSSGLEQMDSTAPTYKVFCLALVASSSGHSPGLHRPEATAEFPCMESCSAPVATDGQLHDAYQGWLARHGFVPRMRRCRPVIISVGTKSFLTSECPAMLSGIASSRCDLADGSSQETCLSPSSADSKSAEDNMRWMQHEVAFKGLPQQDAAMG